MRAAGKKGEKAGLAEKLAELYVLLMLGIFPLYARYGFLCDIAASFGIEWKGYYFDILSAKFGFFWKLTLLFLLLTGGALLYRRTGGKAADGAGQLPKSGKAAGASKTGVLPRCRAFWERLSGTDRFFAAFLLIHLLSMALSGYPYETWWGSLGRNMGVLMWLLLFGAYCMLTRLYRFRRWHLSVFLASMLLLELWGMTDFFHRDLFGFFREVEDWGAQQTFASSIGNINSYTALTGFAFSLSAVLFILESDWRARLLPFLGTAIGAAATIMGMSDNAVLSMGTALAAIPLLLLRTRDELRRYLLVLAVFFAAMRLSGWVTTLGLYLQAQEGDMGLLLRIGRTALSGYLAGGLLLLSLGLSAMEHFRGGDGQRTADKGDPLLRLLRRMLWVLLLIGPAAVIFVLWDANRGGHPALWAPYRGFLIFNRSWGTGRGLAWSMALDYFFREMPLWQKLLGYGPETYYIITMDHFRALMNAYGYGMFDNAHNEYLNFLLTVGLFGMLSYLGMLLCTIRQLLRNRAAASRAAAIALCAYSVQALVNFAVPFVLPLVLLVSWICLAEKTCIFRGKCYNTINS